MATNAGKEALVWEGRNNCIKTMQLRGTS